MTGDNGEITAVTYPKEMEDTSMPPYDVGDFEFERMQRTADLESPTSPAKMASGMVELEALRKKSMAPVEMEG